jgi:hypothetical protein
MDRGAVVDGGSVVDALCMKLFATAIRDKIKTEESEVPTYA